MLKQHSIKPQKMREALGRREKKRRSTHEASLRRYKKTNVREKKDSHQTHWVLSAQ
jgi:hypothetical protein